jgi:hypothetical protein
MAVIQRTGNVEFNGAIQNTTIIGVDFAQYADIYSSTFVPESGGKIPLNSEDKTIVVGNHVSTPYNNATVFCGVNDTLA